MYLLEKILVQKKDTILFTNRFDLGFKENPLKIDWDPVELSRKTAMISTKLWPPQNYNLFWIDHLAGKSSFKRGTYYRWNVQDKWDFCGFGGS